MRIKYVRALLWIGTIGAAAASLQGCAGSPERVSAEEAFALSASALSGSESYGFVGEIALFDPYGRLGGKSAFEGQVSGHGDLKINWKPGDGISERAHAAKSGTDRPLKLLEALNGRSATISYEEAPMADRPVALRIKLNGELAKARIADGLREEMKLLRTDESLPGLHSAEREKTLASADKKLEAALSTLQVETVVHWTANPKSWFPIRMEEETELNYTWEGVSYREKRTSATDFLAKA